MDSPQAGLVEQPPLAPGAEELSRLSHAGFTGAELQQHKDEVTAQLRAGGFTPQEIAAHFGEAEPDPGPVQQQIEHNVSNLPPVALQRMASNPVEAFAAGFGMSSTGIFRNKGQPMLTPNPEAGLGSQVAAAAGQMFGDLPAMILGGTGGAVAGAAVPVAGETGLGELLGAGAGAAGLPTAMREVMMDAYSRGEIHSWKDFALMAGRSVLTTAQAAAAGMIGGGAGRIAGGLVAPVVGKSVQATVEAVANASGFTAASAAMDGRVPNADDWVVGAALALGTHAALSWRPGAARPELTPAGQRVNSNLQTIYRQTGMPPWEAIRVSQSDPVLRQQLLAQDTSGEPVPTDLRQYAPPEPAPFQPMAPLRLPAPAGGEGVPVEGPVTGRSLLPLVQSLETGGEANPDAAVSHSPAGNPIALGRYQITPGTARQYGFDPERLHEADYNTQAATAILDDLAKRFNGDVPSILIAYNAGPGTTARWLAAGRDNSVLPPETQKYLANSLRGVRGGGAELVTRPDEYEPTFAEDNLAPRNAGATLQPSGVPYPEKVGTYLENFGKAAGFTWKIFPPETQSSQPGGPAFVRFAPIKDATPEEIERFHDFQDDGAHIRMPNTPDAQYQEWYGLNRYEIIHHEVGHAIDYALNNRRGTTEVIDDPALLAELLSTSQSSGNRARLWLRQPKYMATPPELMADNIATWISDPTMRAKMPLFAAKYGAKLQRYVDVAERALPRRVNGGWRVPPGAEEPPDIGTVEPPSAGGGAGGAGGVGGPPGPPGGRGVSPATPPGPPPAPRIPLNEEMLNSIMDDQIGERGKPQSVLDPSLMYRQFISELGPAREMDAQLAARGFLRDIHMGIEDMMRQTYASQSRVGYMVTRGGLDPITFTQTGRASMMDAMKAAKAAGGDARGFRNYLLAQRAIQLESRGLEHGFKLEGEDLQRLVEFGKDKYGQATSLFRDFTDAGLEYGQDSGVFNQAQVDAMRRDNQTYITYDRILGEEPSTRRVGRSFRTAPPVRRFRSGDEQITDPFRATIQNMSRIVSMSDRNRAIGSVITLAERHGLLEDYGLLRVAGPENKAWITPPGGKEVPLEKPEAYEPFWAERASRKGGLKDNQFIYIRNGVPELWQTADPALATLLRAADTPGQANVVSSIAHNMASIARAGLVAVPDFPTRVTLRHQITAFLADPHSPPPFVTWLRGAMSAFKQDDRYWDFVANGGAGSSLAEMDTDYLAKNIEQVFTETGTWSAAWNSVTHPLHFAQLVSERLDAAGRIGYKSTLEAHGIEPLKAATMGRKAYLDYAEKGTLGIAQWMARSVPFMRPHFLGLKQFGEAAMQNPGSTLIKVLSVVTAGNMALYAMNYLQDEYGGLSENEKFRNIPRQERDNYFITPQLGGVRVRLQMPPVIGLPFGGFPTRFLDHFLLHDPHAFDNWAKSLATSFSPPIIPDFILPPLETVSNHNFFAGKPLIPDSLKNLSPDLQYTMATSEPAKALSHLLKPLPIDPSPIVMDTFVKEWTGSVGQLALKALSAPMGHVHAPWEITDIPFVQSFLVRHAGADAEPIQNFYTDRDTVVRENNDFLTLRRAAQVGGPVGPAAEAYRQIDLSLAAVNRVADVIRTQRAILDAVNRDTEMSNHEKLQAVDTITSNMITTAKYGTQLVQAAHKARVDAQQAETLQP